jgi:hypothetical protein
MAQIGISEFTFGYAFLFEQTHANWAGLTAAPVLPSLQQEQDAGWDAHLPLTGTDFYYQFKLSDYLSRSNASYIADGTYATPYYRISLHRRNGSQQHCRLRQLSMVKPHTYYVAPEFNSIEHFNSRFLARQVTADCRIIPVNVCEDITDNEQHCITFRQGDPLWTFHSERQRHERSYRGAELGEIYGQTKSRWRPIDLHFAEGLFEQTRDFARSMVAEEDPQGAERLRPMLDDGVTVKERRHFLMRTADILSTTVGVTLVLVGSRA